MSVDGDRLPAPIPGESEGKLSNHLSYLPPPELGAGGAIRSMF
jgi:hypothetical protein